MNQKIKSADISVIHKNLPSKENTHTFESQFRCIDDNTSRKNKVHDFPGKFNQNSKLYEEKSQVSKHLVPNYLMQKAEENSVLIKEDVSDKEELMLNSSVLNKSHNLDKLENQMKISRNILLIDSYKKFEKVKHF
jgi:hypothetical protein